MIELLVWTVALVAADQVWTRLEFREYAEEFSGWLVVVCAAILCAPPATAAAAFLLASAATNLTHRHLPRHKRVFNTWAMAAAALAALGVYLLVPWLLVAVVAYEIVANGLFFFVMPREAVWQLWLPGAALAVGSAIIALLLVAWQPWSIVAAAALIIAFLRPVYRLPLVQA